MAATIGSEHMAGQSWMAEGSRSRLDLSKSTRDEGYRITRSPFNFVTSESSLSLDD